VSVNADPISSRLEGGTASVEERLQGLRRLGLEGGYPIGVVIAPIMPIDDWQQHYTQLLDRMSDLLDFDCDLTFELISHRFTPGSKDVLLSWYPNTKLDMDESTRVIKRNKFGGMKYVYDAKTMRELRQFFDRELKRRFPKGEILYWT
jgi:spore photoproduct lyase